MECYRRNLPHWHPEGACLYKTWRLPGSLAGVFGDPSVAESSAGEIFRSWDARLDRASCGPVWLDDPRLAAMVVDALKEGQDQKSMYRLLAYVVMSNHVHVLLEPRSPVKKVTQWVKGVTAREANRLLARQGSQFWQRESCDHWVRTESEGQRVVRYIEFNPVSAGRVKRAEDWPWSSGWKPAGDSFKRAQAETCATELLRLRGT